MKSEMDKPKDRPMPDDMTLGQVISGFVIAILVLSGLSKVVFFFKKN